LSKLRFCRYVVLQEVPPSAGFHTTSRTISAVRCPNPVRGEFLHTAVGCQFLLNFQNYINPGAVLQPETMMLTIYSENEIMPKPVAEVYLQPHPVSPSNFPIINMKPIIFSRSTNSAEERVLGHLTFPSHPQEMLRAVHTPHMSQDLAVLERWRIRQFSGCQAQAIRGTAI
jgi:hypothetical protein